MALSSAQRKANEKYIKEHYSQVKLSMPNEEAEALTNHCQAIGCTKAGFIRQAIREKIQRDNAGVTDCGGIKPDQPLPPSYYRGQTDIQPALDENGDIIPEEVG